jgi:hypothetical protein
MLVFFNGTFYLIQMNIGTTKNTYNIYNEEIAYHTYDISVQEFFFL